MTYRPPEVTSYPFAKIAHDHAVPYYMVLSMANYFGTFFRHGEFVGERSALVLEDRITPDLVDAVVDAVILENKRRQLA